MSCLSLLSSMKAELLLYESPPVHMFFYVQKKNSITLCNHFVTVQHIGLHSPAVMVRTCTMKRHQPTGSQRYDQRSRLLECFCFCCQLKTADYELFWGDYPSSIQQPHPNMHFVYLIFTAQFVLSWFSDRTFGTCQLGLESTTTEPEMQ